MAIGPWILPVLKVLAALRGLRGGILDVFGYTPERRAVRRLLAEYEALLDESETRLSPQTHATSVALAGLPAKVRGFGPVKMRNLEAVRGEWESLLAQLRTPAP